jgi:hypothetical protein
MGWHEELTGNHEGFIAQLLHASLVLPFRLICWGLRQVRFARLSRQGWTRAD